MQTLTGGVQIQGDLVIHNGKLQLIFDAGLRQPAHFIFLTQPLGGSLFHNCLTVRHAHKLAVQAVPLHRKLAVRGDEVLQGSVVHALKQLLKGLGGKLCQNQQNPLACSQAHIGLCHFRHTAGKEHSAVFCPDIGDIQPL